MDVVGGDGAVEHGQPIALLGFKGPSHPGPPISGKLEPKLLLNDLMTPVGDMPNVAAKIVSVGSGHRLSLCDS